MRNLFRLIFIICSFIASTTSFADTDMQYHQTKLPDGSTQTVYTDSDGNKMSQIQHPDGTMEMHAVDKDGNETTSVQHPDGTTDVKTKEKAN